MNNSDYQVWTWTFSPKPAHIEFHVGMMLDDDGTPNRIRAEWVHGEREFEPVRTCHDLGGEEGTNFEGYDFGCSECGYVCDLPQPNYCPNCGAMVVGE